MVERRLSAGSDRGSARSPLCTSSPTPWRAGALRTSRWTCSSSHHIRNCPSKYYPAPPLRALGGAYHRARRAPWLVSFPITPAEAVLRGLGARCSVLPWPCNRSCRTSRRRRPGSRRMFAYELIALFLVMAAALTRASTGSAVSREPRGCRSVGPACPRSNARCQKARMAIAACRGSRR